MANLINERFRVLFLTSQNELIADDLVWEGTVGEAPAYPREVVKRALEVGATGIILVHNHPSGSHQPSQGDIDATRRIAEAASMMGICVHDHIVSRAPDGRASGCSACSTLQATGQTDARRDETRATAT